MLYILHVYPWAAVIAEILTCTEMTKACSIIQACNIVCYCYFLSISNSRYKYANHSVARIVGLSKIQGRKKFHYVFILSVESIYLNT